MGCGKVLEVCTNEQTVGQTWDLTRSRHCVPRNKQQIKHGARMSLGLDTAAVISNAVLHRCIPTLLEPCFGDASSHVCMCKAQQCSSPGVSKPLPEPCYPHEAFLQYMPHPEAESRVRTATPKQVLPFSRYPSTPCFLLLSVAAPLKEGHHVVGITLLIVLNQLCCCTRELRRCIHD